jgi:DNA invertase Pin-like site-specific DNA recombinase
MSTGSPKIAIYLRVSTLEQSCDLQRTECLAYCQSRNWTNIAIYEDTGISGTHANRPALKRLLADIRAGRVQILLCWKMCRLFRSLKDLVITLQELSERKIGFLALKDQIDLTTSTGRLLMHLLGAL